jgi:hypothetical protein
VRYRNKGSYKTSKDYYVSTQTKSSHGFSKVNYNSFSPPLDIKCYECNNYGNMACDYRNIITCPKQNKEEYSLIKHREE